jgi:hypothetical protein
MKSLSLGQSLEERDYFDEASMIFGMESFGEHENHPHNAGIQHITTVWYGSR